MSIKYQVENGVAVLEFARPEKRNALTQEMYAALIRGLEAAEADESVGAIVITGQPGIFTAGNDLADFVEAPPEGEDIPARGFMSVLWQVEKPVVAAVTGPAVGVGATLLLHCDLVFIAEGATLSMPFVRLGLVPEFGSSLLLAQRIGYVKAAAALLLCDPIPADEAVRLGLANAALPAEEVLPHAVAQAARFNGLPPDGVRASKRLMRRVEAQLVEETIAAEFHVFNARLGGPEAREAVAAFFEKRAPDFRRARAEDGR